MTVLFLVVATIFIAGVFFGGLWLGAYLERRVDEKTHLVRLGGFTGEPWGTIAISLIAIAIVTFLIVSFFPAGKLIEQANQIRSQTSAIGALN